MVSGVSSRMAEPVRVGRLSLIKSLPEHAEYVADNMRKLDVRECYIHNLTPLEALTEPMAIHGAVTYTLRLDKTPIGMCGTVPIDDTSGRVWLLGTDQITHHFRPFLRGCKPTVELLQSHYGMIENFVPADHHDTIMWLSWCGFVFDRTMYEINGHTFMRFERCVADKNNVIGELSRPVMH